MKTLERSAEEFYISLPHYKKWTLEECDRLREAGYLPDRFELIEGVIVDKTEQTSVRASCVSALVNTLVRLYGVDRLRVQLPIRILGEAGRVNEPLPDVAVTRGKFHSYKENPLSKDLLLVVEVSDSSLYTDLNTKALLYSQAGIEEYWVLDVVEARLVAHRSPTTNGYENITEWTKGESIAPLSRSNQLVTLEELFSQEATEETDNGV